MAEISRNPSTKLDWLHESPFSALNWMILWLQTETHDNTASKQRLKWPNAEHLGRIQSNLDFLNKVRPRAYS